MQFRGSILRRWRILLSNFLIVAILALAPQWAEPNQWQTNTGATKPASTVNGLEFRILVDNVWKFPGVAVDSKFKLVLDIKNLSKEVINVNYHSVFKLILKDEKGKLLKRGPGGGNAAVNLARAWSAVQPNKSAKPSFACGLRPDKVNKENCVFFYNDSWYQGSWGFEGMPKGIYEVSMIYENKEETARFDNSLKFWTGNAETPSEKVVIK